MTSWQPVETAPKDGSYILVHEHGDVVIARWSGSLKKWIGPRDSYGDVDYMQPDVWMPIPEPPHD